MSSASRVLHVVLPGDVQAPTGGNIYDRRVIDELTTAYGWQVRRTDLAGAWPLPDDAATGRLARVLAQVPSGGIVLVDGLVACGVPAVIEEAARRVSVVVLVHLPLSDETGLAAVVAQDLAARESRTLRAASAVVVTSPWAARRLQAYDLPAARVHVAEPGTDRFPLRRPRAGRDGRLQLICVAAVTPRKDQLTLVRALHLVSELPWECTLIGPLDRDRAYVAAVRDEIARTGLEARVRLAGPLPQTEVRAAYDAADLVLLVSLTETFGMVITEAIGRGVPVLTTSGGAAAETLGTAPDGTVPGLLVPPGDVATLAAALRAFLTDPALRARLTTAAVDRRQTLGSWADTTRRVADVLDAQGALVAKEGSR